MFALTLKRLCSTRLASFADIIGGSHCMTPATAEPVGSVAREYGSRVHRCLLHHNPNLTRSWVGSRVLCELRAALSCLKRKSRRKDKSFGVAPGMVFVLRPQLVNFIPLPRMVEQAHVSWGAARISLHSASFQPRDARALVCQSEYRWRRFYVLEAADALGVTVVSRASSYKVVWPRAAGHDS